MCQLKPVHFHRLRSSDGYKGRDTTSFSYDFLMECAHLNCTHLSFPGRAVHFKTSFTASRGTEYEKLNAENVGT